MKKDVYISIDIEADGPIPGDFSMSSLGAVVVGQPHQTFYREFQPITKQFDKQAAAVSGLDREKLVTEGANPTQAMKDFAAWIADVAKGDRPVFVGFNCTFDWSFVHWYFIHFTGSDPFGIAGLDIKAYYMGALGKPLWGDTTKGTSSRASSRTCRTRTTRSRRRARAGRALRQHPRVRGPAQVRSLAALLLVGATACFGAGPRSPRIVEILPAAPDPLPTAPALRLPPGVRPTHYTLELTVDPGAKTFGGQVIIDVELDQPSDFIWLSSAELDIAHAHVSYGGTTTPVRPIVGGEGAEFVGLALGRSVGPGAARLTIDYQGTFARGGIGLFKAKDGPDWYAVTQFEATYARRTVPCFDEPGWKTPWSITLHIPPRDKAFANTPVENDAADGTMRVVKFAETKPLPSYLVAFAVGPFDIVELGHAGKKNTPIRILVPRGRSREAAWAAQITPELLTRLEGYSGTPYPYEKLDLLGIPITDFGAMENAGLITFDGPLLLGDPQAPSIHDQHETALTITHEMAHQWFGDLVTTSWWNDIWLNEAFATWMESKIVDEWKPEWKIAAEVINSTDDAMGIDALQGTRRVHEPVESHDDEVDAFDSITYEKGAAIISMIETWIGPDAFGRAVRAHLAKHAFGNATTADFIQSVNEASGRDTTGVFGSFLDQPGVPLVTSSWIAPTGSRRASSWRSSAGGPPAPPRVKMTVSGRSRCASATAAWAARRAAAPSSTTRARRSSSPDARSCPSWVVGNDGAAGYYRVRYEGGMLAKLATRKELTLRERLALVNDLDALVSGGAIPADEALRDHRRSGHARHRSHGGRGAGHRGRRFLQARLRERGHAPRLREVRAKGFRRARARARLDRAPR